MNTRRGIWAGWILAVAAIPALAHHSFSSEFDANKKISISGVISKVELINPHGYVHVDVTDRQSGKVVSSFGRGAGHFPGQFVHAHGIAVDSKGNVYVAEVNEGKRVQKFKIAGQ